MVTESVSGAVDDLVTATAGRLDPEAMPWDWGEGLLLYALARRGAEYLPLVARYFAAHRRRGLPRIDWSDKCAPALAALEAYRVTGEQAYLDVGERVAAYLRSAKPTSAGGLNHFGTYWYARLYPQSMWVDSLMMYGVFAARWGRVVRDRAMSDFAAQQALAFARVLQDRTTGLWRHAWFVRARRAVPGGDAYWLRGNGWAVAALAEILDALPTEHPDRPALAGALARTARSLVAHQHRSGLWRTVLTRRTYLETSGSALCAYGLLTGVRAGHLPSEHRAPAERAIAAIVARLEPRADGLSMPGISGATMPYPSFGYALIPRRRDRPYGIAALLLADEEVRADSRPPSG